MCECTRCCDRLGRSSVASDCSLLIPASSKLVFQYRIVYKRELVPIVISAPVFLFLFAVYVLFSRTKCVVLIDSRFQGFIIPNQKFRSSLITNPFHLY